MTRCRTSLSELERLALALSTRAELRSARAEALEVFRSHPNAATPDGSASLEDAALQHFYGAIQLATISDPANPEILAAFGATQSLAVNSFGPVEPKTKAATP